ncbi:phosphopyruvate hydratase, partial [Candidatus Woesearchaeota archaeon]|nr:phosphopyruvate hydratase [Candidatus Woesearchaeota archaeon]
MVFRMNIKSIAAREILDSRGNPTIEVYLTTEDGICSYQSVPSGASTGIHEAQELRDGGTRYHGLGVQKAVNNVSKIIAKRLKGLDVANQELIDKTLIKLDGTKDKRRLGANAILGVSLAAARAAAYTQDIPTFQYIARLAGVKKPCLPLPCANVINGGRHAGNGLDFQEYMIIPTGAKSFAQATQMVAETYRSLKQLLLEQYGMQSTNVGDEGGFAPVMKHYLEPIKVLQNAIEQAGYDGKIKLALDCAASEFYNAKDRSYDFEGVSVSTKEMRDRYIDLIDEFPIISIEDPFHQEDFTSFAEFAKMVGRRCQIVGDDLLTTNPARIREAISKRSCSVLLLKPNQIGTLTESIASWRLASNAGWRTMVSHRSGETTDTFIADLAVGLGTGQIKLGAPARGERVAKYNELLRLEEEHKL